MAMAAFLSSAVSCNRDVNEGNPKVKHVVLIGLDGWGSSYFPESDMPFVHEMMEQGAWTLKKRSVFPSSSAPNWGSMVSGVGPELHGFVRNTETPEIPPRELAENGHFPTVFTLAREAHPDAEIGVSYMWPGILPVLDTLSLNVFEHFETSDEGAYAEVEWADRYLKEKKPLLSFFYINMPDPDGHYHGWGGPEYMARQPRLDSLVRRIVTSVKEAGMYDDSVIILTSDHGGIGKKHGGSSIEEMEAPLVIIGKGVRKGYELRSSVVQYDIASTMAWLLGIEQPQAWTGRPVKEAFGK